MIKIVCSDNTIEVSAEVLKDVPFFKPMLEGEWEKDTIEVEEDEETFVTVLNCIKDKFEYLLHENDYHLYKAYHFYMCTTPDKYFFVSDSGSVHSLDKSVHRSFSRSELEEDTTRVPYNKKVIQEAINWIHTYVRKANHTRSISAEAADFICDYMLRSVSAATVGFIVHEGEVLCDNVFDNFHGRKNTKIICRNPGVFALIKDYANDQRCIENENRLWESVKNFLSLHYHQFGNLMYKSFIRDSGLCYKECPSGEQRYWKPF